MSSIWQLTTLAEQQQGSYAEFLQIESMSLGIYKLPAGSVDDQTPHREDEAYYVLEGRAKIDIAGDVTPVQAGMLVFIPRNVEHRFIDIEHDLILLVIFAPAFSG